VQADHRQRLAAAAGLHQDMLTSDEWYTTLTAKLRALRDEVLPDMQEAYAMTEEGYRAGRVELLRVLEAQRALLDSRLSEAEAVATWTRAVADLERALGTDLAGGAAHAP